jgi:hypothetical protein
MNRRFKLIQHPCTLIIVCLIFRYSSAQFIDHFDDVSLLLDPSAEDGWAFYTGDGSACMDFRLMDGYASIIVDASEDRRNVWWALIRRRVSSGMDLNLLNDSRYELRIKARIRVSHAPRRVNLHLNTQRTTDFHTHLMEFDIPDTVNWHTISMTTHDFDGIAGDRVYGQLALMDWGREQYRVDLDYFAVDIVHIDSIGPDKGVQVPYHPPVPSPETFSHHVPAVQDVMIDSEYPNMNFNGWSTQTKGKRIYLLTVSGTQFIILRWDLNRYKGRKAVGAGILELRTYSVQHSSMKEKDFGMIRVVEIVGGDPIWEQNEVTYSSFCRGQSVRSVFNSQMIIDVDVAEGYKSANLITISEPVLQRLLDGETLGLAIQPLGAISASFYAMENRDEEYNAKLHFNDDSH